MKRLKKYNILLAISFLTLLASEEIIAQFIDNQNARMDVRGTSRRTARRVNRRHDYVEADNYYAAPAPAAAAAGAAVATAAVLTALPAGCIDNNGIFDCNGIRYQAQMQGTQVVYVQIQ